MQEKIYKNTEGLEFKVLYEHKVKGKIQWKVQFLKSGSIRSCSKYNAQNGEVKDYLHRSIVGVGFLGQSSPYIPKNKAIFTRWKDMIKRCYEKNHTSYKYYGGKGVRVCKEWQCYSVFYQWCIEYLQDLDITGKELDKDLFSEGTGKMYSPEFCHFIPARLNKVIRQKDLIRGISSYRSSKYNHSVRARYQSLFEGKEIGKTFHCGDSAIQWLKENRDKEILRYADINLSQGLINKKVYDRIYEIYSE